METVADALFNAPTERHFKAKAQLVNGNAMGAHWNSVRLLHVASTPT
jgi:hypothetical protein